MTDTDSILELICKEIWAESVREGKCQTDHPLTHQMSVTLWTFATKALAAHGGEDDLVPEDHASAVLRVESVSPHLFFQAAN